MKYSYKTSGTCSSEISFELGGDGIIHDVKFTGGCNGNLKAIASLVEGWHYKDVVARTEGNTCGMRPTSCADQLSKALLVAAEREGLK